uniref:BspA family leucine-rich repeat surface protein n=1 Tax=viral metagenome TaxID=1070528 RepID=A0A6C0HPG0_9ZZZZ
MEPITNGNIHRLVKEYLTNAISGLPNISGWDVSNVTNMQNLFEGYEYFDKNLGSWDVSNVENMYGMFAECTNYTGDGLDAWGKKVGKVTDMTYMFSESVNLIVNLGSWDVSNVENMYGMFYQCTNFTGDGLDAWGKKVVKVTDMSYMFKECENLIVNLGSWDVSNVENMYGMFRKCTNFTGDGLDAWGNKVGKVIDMSYMFVECENLIVNISRWVVNPNLVSTDIFQGCTSMPIEYRFVVPVLSDDDDADEEDDEEEDDDDYEKAGETIAPKDKCFWSSGPYDIESKNWLKKSGNFIVQVPDIETKSSSSGIILTESENYHCLSLEYLKRVSKIERKKDKYETFHECSKDVMAKVLAPNGITPLGFGYDDDKKDYNLCVSYVKIDTYFVEKPDWFWNGPVPEPRKFKLVKIEGGEKYLVSRSIALYGHNAISGVHCDKSDKYYIYKLAPIVDNTEEKNVQGGGTRKKNNNKRYIKKSTIRFKKTTNKHTKNGRRKPIKSKLTRKVKLKNKKTITKMKKKRTVKK